MRNELINFCEENFLEYTYNENDDERYDYKWSMMIDLPRGYQCAIIQLWDDNYEAKLDDGDRITAILCNFDFNGFIDWLKENNVMPIKEEN